MTKAVPPDLTKGLDPATSQKSPTAVELEALELECEILFYNHRS